MKQERTIKIPNSSEPIPGNKIMYYYCLTWFNFRGEKVRQEVGIVKADTLDEADEKLDKAFPGEGGEAPTGEVIPLTDFYFKDGFFKIDTTGWRDIVG